MKVIVYTYIVYSAILNSQIGKCPMMVFWEYFLLYLFIFHDVFISIEIQLYRWHRKTQFVNI